MALLVLHLPPVQAVQLSSATPAHFRLPAHLAACPCSCNWEWESTNNLALEVLRLLLEGCTTTPEGACWLCFAEAP